MLLKRHFFSRLNGADWPRALKQAICNCCQLICVWVFKTAAYKQLPKTKPHLSSLLFVISRLPHFLFLSSPASPSLLFPAEAEGTQTQGVCSQRGLQIVEGPSQTGESSQTPAPACTAATGYSEVCVWKAVHLCVRRPGQESRGVRVHHIQSTYLRCDGCIRSCACVWLS